MDLILWRHADAADAPPGEADLERALTPKGERQAERMAAWLNPRLARSARILVSPARRCQQTAGYLGRSFETVTALAPGGNADALLHAARWPASDVPVLVIGHQPTLGFVAATTLAGVAQPWAVKKAAVWWLCNRDRDGYTQVVLQAMQSPELL